MTAPSLKHSLAHWTGLPTIQRTFEPQMTRRAAAKAEMLIGDVQPRAPEADDRQALYRRVVASWNRTHTLAQLSDRDLRRLPWTLFYPAREGYRTGDGGATRVNPQAYLFAATGRTEPEITRWLGANDTILQEYKDRWLSTGRRARSVRILLHEFLLVYPVTLPTFDELRGLLQDAMDGGSSPRPPSLQRWCQRCRDFGFLEEGGAGTFVEKLVSAAEAPEDFLRQAGLDARLARCGFLESGIRRCLSHVESQLRENRLDDTQLDRLLALLACDGRLRFDDRAMRLKVATTLLRPFVERHPQPGIRERLQPFFVRHFGDPRVQSGRRWPSVPDEVRRVVIRWLNERALEQFFLLVKETALDNHWRYREAFWRAFLPLDPDIWFVLGRSARALLQKVNAKSDEPETTATLRGAQGDQSVLLMHLPGVTVAEWSHAGTCRFWLDGTPGAPALYGNVYSRSELTRAANFEQRHHGSPDGRWQDRIMAWLRDNTGIAINRAEYFPNRLHERQRDHNLRHASPDRRSRDRATALAHRVGAPQQTARAETIAQLKQVRHAVWAANRLRVDLRDFMSDGSAAWMAYVADHGPPGYRTRRQTVLERLDSTIARLLPERKGVSGTEPARTR